jgi:hypothetical protein
MLCEVFGEHYFSRTAVSEWHSCLKAGRVSVQDDERSGWPSTNKTTENIEEIRELIHEDCRLTIHELANTTGTRYGVCQEILTKCATKKTGTLAQPQLVPSSWQRACPYVSVNHRVCD